MPPYKTPAFAVFSGGGAQGIALAGAYQAALDSGFEFKGFGGTSAGAMIALMAATGMTGHEIVLESIPNKAGHPAQFFSDPAEMNRPERQLSKILGEWAATVDRSSKTRRLRKKQGRLSYQLGKVSGAPGFWEIVQLRFAALLLILGAAASLVALVIILYPLAKGAIFTRLPTLALPNWNDPLQLALTTIVSAVVLSTLFLVVTRLGRLPAIDYLLLRPRGRYWRWVTHVLGAKFGFLRGTGMQRAFDQLLADKIRMAAERVGQPSLAARPFSTLTFAEFEELFDVPIKIVASDLWSGKPIIFERHGFPNYLVFEAVRASTAFPLAFEPVVERTELTNGDDKQKAVAEIAHVLVDGGLSSNSPAFLFKRESDFCKLPTIAFQLNYSYPGPHYPEDLMAYFSSLTRTAVGAGDTIIQDLVPRMHVVSVTGLEEYGVLDGELSGTAVHRLFELGRARQDDLTRIWKLCRISRESGLALEYEYAPILSAIQQTFSASVNPGSSIVVAVWTPLDHLGSEWRVEQIIGEHDELRLGAHLQFFARQQSETDTDGRDMTETIRRLQRNNLQLQALSVGAVMRRELNVLDFVPGTVAISVPIFSYSVDPDTWLRGQDVVGVLVIAAVNDAFTGAAEDPKEWCNWLRKSSKLEPSGRFAVDPKFARELTNWAQALGRFMVA